MTVPLGRWRGCIGDFRDGELVVSVGCCQPLLGGAADNSGIVTVACGAYPILRTLRATVQHPYLLLWLYQEIVYGAGPQPGWYWTGDGPDGQTVALRLYCDTTDALDPTWRLTFTWGTDTVTLTVDAVAVLPGNSFALYVTGDFSRAGLAATLAVTITS